MRTNIVIDDKLMTKALKASGSKTKREAVETGLHCHTWGRPEPAKVSIKACGPDDAKWVKPEFR